MKKPVTFLLMAAALSTPALAQVRPQDCRPVFPLSDPVQAALPQDVIAERAIPAAAARRGFFGLPLLPLLLAGGACVVACGGGGDGSSESVSPA
jgi:hypothetical protein